MFEFLKIHTNEPNISLIRLMSIMQNPEQVFYLPMIINKCTNLLYCNIHYRLLNIRFLSKLTNGMKDLSFRQHQKDNKCEIHEK